MAECVVCGNEYVGAFTLIMPSGEQFVFDSLECAIDKVAPHCSHCGCRIIGHGLVTEGSIFCCAHCARLSDVRRLTDRS